MSKKSIITLSIVTFMIVLALVLFGAVFCLRTQNVVVFGEAPVTISKEEIISSANLKNGKSIFMLDKDKAIANIEAKYANIKVVQIKTKSLTEIDICVRARHAVFYTTFNNNHYIMDEELKVLDIITSSLESEPDHLIYFQNDLLNINASTLPCDFVGSNLQKEVAYELYYSVINNVKVKNEELTQYYTHADVLDLIEKIEIETDFISFNKIIINTSLGVKFDIEDPTNDLTNKMNICLTTVNKFVKDGENKEKSGTIKIYKDLQGSQQSVYIP